jgi:hypothetical protein
MVTCTPTYTYTPVNRGEGTCTNGQKPVYWDCTRSDGQEGFAASNCGKSNPEYVSCPSTPTYTYTPVFRGEGTCTNNQKPVYWDCTRSDGQQGFHASNCGKSNPEYVTCSTPITYTWNQGGWSGYSSTCSDSATRTRSVWCQGSDGQTYADGNCGGGKPASSETTGVYSSCTYRSEDTGNSGCQGGTITYNTQCRRSDGNLVANSNCGNSGTRTESCSYQWEGDSRCTGTRYAWIEYCNTQGYGSDPGVACIHTGPNSGMQASSNVPGGSRSFGGFETWCKAQGASTCIDSGSIYHSPDERAGGHSTSDSMGCYSGGSVPSGPANVDQNDGSGYVHTENWSAQRIR